MYLHDSKKLIFLFPRYFGFFFSIAFYDIFAFLLLCVALIVLLCFIYHLFSRLWSTLKWNNLHERCSTEFDLLWTSEIGSWQICFRLLLLIKTKWKKFTLNELNKKGKRELSSSADACQRVCAQTAVQVTGFSPVLLFWLQRLCRALFFSRWFLKSCRLSLLSDVCFIYAQG